MSQIRRTAIARTAADEPFFLVRSLAATFASGHAIERHGHGWGQLIYASSGVATVWTEAGSWVAPPHWAIWVPAGVDHAIRFAGACSLQTLYLKPPFAAGLPGDCAVITVSPLLRELIARTAALGMLDERRPVERAMSDLIVAEFQRSETPPFDLPAPVSSLARRAAALIEQEGPDLTSEAIAARTGLGLRALERRFLEETGVSLGQWRRQSALLKALQALATGSSVKAAAVEAGYRTPSAFVAAFSAMFGTTPGRYFAA